MNENDPFSAFEQERTIIKPGAGRGGGGGNGNGEVSDYLKGGAGMVDAPQTAGRGKSGR